MPENTQPHGHPLNAKRPQHRQDMLPGDAAVAKAQQQLRDFIALQAEKITAKVGFTWIAEPDAPENFYELRRCFTVSSMTRQPLPVNSKDAEHTVYGSPEANYQLRFVHDCLHVTSGLTFSSKDEYVLACHFMELAEDHGIRRGTIAWHLLLSDAVGQALYYAITKQYVSDQLRFGMDTVNHGLHRALLMEIERNNAQ